MKILMLGWELPPHNTGGLGVACHEIAKNLALDGVSIDFVLPYTAEHGIDQYTIHGATSVAPAFVLNGNGTYDSSQYICADEVCEHGDLTDLRSLQHHYTKYVERLVYRDVAPDVIHAHDWLTFEAGMRAKQLTKKPLIAHVHATEFDRSGEHSGNPIVHEIEYDGLTMADRIIAVSQVTKDLIVKNYSIPESKVEVIHNAINTSEFAGYTEANQQTYQYLEMMKQHGYTVVVSLGRLTVQKGLRYFLEAAAQASRINNRLLFLVAGDGEQRSELIEYSAELGISDKVLFAGFVRGAQLRDAYTIGDMFVMSSVSEPFGLTALEAAGSDNAIILTKQSGVGEVLHNVLRYDYWDVTTLANQMAMTSLYPTLQNELSRNALHEFNHFSWGKVSRQCANLYESYKVASGAVV